MTEGVLSGQLSPKVANSAIYGLSSIGRLLEVECLESRLASLERRTVDLTEPRRGPRMVGHA